MRNGQELYCKCGGIFVSQILTPGFTSEMLGEWRAAHSGEGHGDCDRQAWSKAVRARVRRNLERMKKEAR